MSNITTFSQAGLPSAATLATALRSVANEVGDVGTVILKMDKTGHWVFGSDQTEVEADSTWAINPFSFVHGFIAWGDGEVLAERMVPVSEPLPEVPDAPPGAKRGWETQIGMSLKCLSGEDEGMEARFSTTSVGGKRAVTKLAVDLAEQVERDQSKPVAVVQLEKDSYSHKSYGRIFTPVFDIQKWIGLDGPEAAPAAAEPEAEAAPAADAPVEGGRRRRRAA
jgi:hypothetical protein